MKFATCFIFFVLIHAHICQAQKQKDLAKFIIQDARLNGIDVTHKYLNTDAFVVLYTTAEDDVCMAVVMDKSDTQSFGDIYDFKTVEEKPETDKNYKMEVYEFRWSYKNNYDKKQGTAKVQLTKVYKPLGIMFTMIIIPENLDMLQFKGFMEGTIGYPKK